MTKLDSFRSPLAALAAAGVFMAGWALIQAQHQTTTPGILGAGVYVPASASTQAGGHWPGNKHPGARHPGSKHPGVDHPGGYHPGNHHPGTHHPGRISPN